MFPARNCQRRRGIEWNEPEAPAQVSTPGDRTGQKVHHRTLETLASAGPTHPSVLASPLRPPVKPSADMHKGKKRGGWTANYAQRALDTGARPGTGTGFRHRTSAGTPPPLSISNSPSAVPANWASFLHGKRQSMLVAARKRRARGSLPFVCAKALSELMDGWCFVNTRVGDDPTSTCGGKAHALETSSSLSFHSVRVLS